MSSPLGLLYKRGKYLVYLYIMVFSSFDLWAQTENVIISNTKIDYQIKIEDEQPVVYAQEETEYTTLHHADNIRAACTINDFISLQKATCSKQRKAKFRSVINEDVFYNNALIAYFDIQLFGKGKTAKTKFERKYSHLRHLSSICLSNKYYISQKEITITAPSTFRTLKILEKNLPADYILQRGITKEGDSIWHYTFHDLPPVSDESRQPDYFCVEPHLTFLGGFSNWSTLYQWLLSLTEDNEDETEVHRKAEAITSHCHNDWEKLAALYEWIQQNIRYIAIESGISAFKPDTPLSVLQKRYGDCKGKATLLREMGRSLNLDIRFVWAHTSEGIPSVQDMPTLSAFNHLLCAYYDGNDFLFLDPSGNSLPLRAIPDNLQGKYVLIESGKEGIIRQIPILPPSCNSENIHIDFFLKEDTLTGKAEHQWSGVFKEFYHSAKEQLPSNRYTTFLSSLLSNKLESCTVDSICHNGFSPKDSVATLRYLMKDSRHIEKIGNRLYMDLHPVQSYLSVIDTTKRKYDYHHPFRYKQTISCTVYLPEGSQVISLPTDVTKTNHWFDYKRHCTIKDNKIIYSYHFIFHHPLIHRKEMEEFNRLLNEERFDVSEQICIQPFISSPEP